MGAKHDVDDVLYVKAKVVSVSTDENGTVYQVKYSSQDKTTTQYFKEDELIDTIPSI